MLKQRTASLRVLRLFIGSFVLFAVAACSTPTRYEPAVKKGESGFTEARIEQNRFRITFRGGSGASAARVKDLALLRAADLALSNSYEWFEVVNSYEEAFQGPGPSIGLGVGGGNFGGSTAVGVGVSSGFKLSGPVRATTMEVLMGNGPRPDRPNAYDAKSIKDSIGATLK